MTVVISAFGLLATLSSEASFYKKDFIWSLISVFFIGSSQALIPISIDLAVEICHPVAESITNGLLMSTGNLFGIILSLSLSMVI